MIDDKTIQACARAAHEANRAFCIATGDDTQPPWESAPDWQRTSAMNGVRGVLVDGNDPKASHESWLREKAEDGWQYGPTKDSELKTHPCFLPYEKLSQAQKSKDDIFVAVVKAIAQALKTID